MQIRNLGTRSGFQVPRANIGAMRLPPDFDEAVALIRRAIDAGMHYIDTSRGYGDSEKQLAQALKDGYREKVILSTKWSAWNGPIDASDDSSAECVRRRLEESMRWLEVDYLDFYQVWSISAREHYDQTMAKGGMLEGILQAKEDGLIGHLGFTTHDSPENILDYLEEAGWCEVILVSYNLLSQNYAPVLEAAHKKGIGTLVMNPMSGGLLARPSSVLDKLAEEVGAVSVPDMAIRYVLSNPNVDSLLCGMTKSADVDDTIAAAERPLFSAEQCERIETAVRELAPENVGACTGCEYCLPCPQEINIPAIMKQLYQFRYWGRKEAAQRGYDRLKGPRADACEQCGECEEKCTQKLPIMAEMEHALDLFGG